MATSRDRHIAENLADGRRAKGALVNIRIMIMLVALRLLVACGLVTGTDQAGGTLTPTTQLVRLN